MQLARNIGLLLAALLIPHLYKRVQTLRSLEKNAPGKLQAFTSFKSHEIQFRDKLRNCEDVILLDGYEGWALLSCDAGRDYWNTVMGIFTNASHAQGALHIYNYVSPTAQPIPLTLLNFPSATTDFHPLGVSYHGQSSTLYVANHAFSGSTLEVFRLSLPTSGSSCNDAKATHIRTLSHPKIHTPNAIAVLDESNILLTNDHWFRSRYHPWLAMLETYLGIPGGDVVHIYIPPSTSAESSAGTPELAITTLSHIPFANGIEVLNSTTLAVASTTTTAVQLYSIIYTIPPSSLSSSTSKEGQRKYISLAYQAEIPVPFLPDNLSLDNRGKLWIAGHGHARATGAFAHSRAACRGAGTEEEREKACSLRSPSFVATWTEEEGVRVVYKGVEFSTGCTAVWDQDAGVGVVSGLFEDGIVRFTL